MNTGRLKNIQSLLDRLDTKRSKATVIEISELCDKEDFDRLYQELLVAPDRRRGSLSWVLAYSMKDELWTPDSQQLQALIGVMTLEKEDMMCKRCLMDIFQYAALEEDHMGPLVDVAMASVRNPKEPLAIRCFALTVLARVMKRYPDLRSEVNCLLDELLRTGEPSLRARVRKVMEMMAKP